MLFLTERAKCTLLVVLQLDGHKIDCIRVLVDVERGRAVPNWLGGDLGPQELVENLPSRLLSEEPKRPWEEW